MANCCKIMTNCCKNLSKSCKIFMNCCKSKWNCCKISNNLSKRMPLKIKFSLSAIVFFDLFADVGDNANKGEVG